MRPYILNVTAHCLHVQICQIIQMICLLNPGILTDGTLFSWNNVKILFSVNEGILDFNNVSSQSQMDEGIKTLTDLLNNDIEKYFRVKPFIGNDTKKYLQIVKLRTHFIFQLMTNHGLMKT